MIFSNHFVFLTIFWYICKSEAFWLTDTNLLEPREVLSIATSANESIQSLMTTATPSLLISATTTTLKPQITSQNSSQQIISQLNEKSQSIVVKNNNEFNTENQVGFRANESV